MFICTCMFVVIYIYTYVYMQFSAIAWLIIAMCNCPFQPLGIANKPWILPWKINGSKVSKETSMGKREDIWIGFWWFLVINLEIFMQLKLLKLVSNLVFFTKIGAFITGKIGTLSNCLQDWRCLKIPKLRVQNAEHGWSTMCIWSYQPD